MSSSVAFFLVDVFASRPLTGNPLAVVPDADHLRPEQMRAIAKEFNQSETTFLVRPTRDGADRRLLSLTAAGVEVGGAGHNALGAWLWLADRGLVAAGDHVQQIGEDLLPLTVVRGPGELTSVRMSQRAPSYGEPVTDADAVAALTAALGLTPSDLDPLMAVQPVATGVHHLMVPVRDAAAVDRAGPDAQALRRVLVRAGAEGAYVFTADPGTVDPLAAHAYSRFFNPTVGITEDPATGTAAGPLAAALVRAGRAEDGADVIVEQGHHLGRPSRLVVHVDGDAVALSGSGLVVGEGRLRI